MEKADKPKTNRRKLEGLWFYTVSGLLIISSLFHIYTGGFGLLSTMSQRSLHLLFTLAPVFLLYSATKKNSGRVQFYDVILSVTVLVACLYTLLTWRKNIMRIGDPALIEYVLGGLLLLLVLEGTRRTCGNGLTIVAGILLLYCYVGKYLPGALGHRGYSIKRIISFFAMSTEGIYGVPLGVSASMIILFVIFGGILNATGGGRFFIDMTYSITGRYRGGAAKTSVFASALMGMISGSPIANVVTTGTFTLPLMEKGGFSKNMSAAVCAMAAAGGILMPPVMGAAAFIMAEYLSMSYGEVALAALMPSILFYAAIFVIVDIEAVKRGLHGEKKENLPVFAVVMKNGWHLLLPILALIVFLMMSWSAAKAVFWAMVILIAVSFLKKETRLDKQKILKALIDGTREAIPIAVACAAAGIVVGSLALTGLGVKFSSSIVSLAHGSKLIALIMAMLASLVLGMGMPATAVYILSASLLAPPLIQLGVPAIGAHFFVFYFSVISCITPPVALTTYAAAGLAKTDPNKAGWTAFYYGILAYIIPFVFVYDTTLLWQGNIFRIMLALITALIGIYGIGAALQGYMTRKLNAIKRVLLFIAGVMAVVPNLLFSLIGIAIIAAIIFVERKGGSKAAASA